MRKLLFFAALLAASLAHGVTLVDRIVAVVNKEVITYSELYEAVGMAERQLRRQGTPAPERPVLERQMLERLILDKAQLQLARETGIRVDELQKSRPEGAEYNLAHILVRVPEGASPERIRQARERAEQALAEVKGGAPFARVAASFSDAPDALQGGAIGWRSHDRLPELFSEVLAKMNPGEVSEPLRSPAGFHLLQLADRRGAGAQAAAVRQTRMRHILIRTSEAVSESEARRKLLDLRDRIVSGGADFAELARVHSDDGTAARGGELDWVYAGDTVPEFERAY